MSRLHRRLSPQGGSAGTWSLVLLLAATGLLAGGCAGEPSAVAQQAAGSSEAPAPKAGPTAPSVRLTEVPEDLDLSFERLSAQGSLIGSLSHGQGPIPLGQLHSWTLKLEDPSGEPLTGARIRVDGGMPQHSHGLPTQPLARPSEVPGTYVVEGVRFQMRGWWQLIFVVEVGGGDEVLTFNLILE